MPWYYAVAERDHDIQNPTSAEKIRLLGERLRLDATDRVLDMACGRGGPALVLASAYGCRILGVERAPEFASAAAARVREAGLEHLVEIVQADAREFPIAAAEWDAALCLGASFVWDGLEGTLAALAPAVRDRGYVVVGEPYWRSWPLPAGVDDDGYLPLAGTVERIEGAGLRVVTLITSSVDDWDRYETLHWRAVEEWLGGNEGDPHAQEIRRHHEDAKRTYLRHGRDHLGWAVFVAWKPG